MLCENLRYGAMGTLANYLRPPFVVLQVGERTMASIFREAGCLEPSSPSCAACLGGPADTYARMNEPVQCISTTNRNFPGRMGHKVFSLGMMCFLWCAVIICRVICAW